MAAFLKSANLSAGRLFHRWGATRCRIVECIKQVRIPGMFLPDPTQACYRCADDGVRSPADKVPNWVRMATGEPLQESSPVKGRVGLIW